MKMIQCKINGVERKVHVEYGETLLEMLRERLKLTGTKKGCSVGECGACTVLVDDEAVDSCIYLAAWADGKSIVTVEGLSRGLEISVTQQAYLDEGAVQCGFCIPGFLMSTEALLKEIPDPTEQQIRVGLSGNMCRCTGYAKIVKAVQRAAREKAAQSPQ